MLSKTNTILTKRGARIATILGWICALSGSVASATYPNCSAGHCSDPRISVTGLELCKGNAELLGMTMEEYKQKGGKAVAMENGAGCYCPCSCVVADTLVSTLNGNQRIEFIQMGDMLLTPMASTPIGSVTKLHYSKMEEVSVIKTEFSNGQSIVSSPNHTFVTPNEKVISAQNLRKGTQVLGSNGSIVEVAQNPVSEKVSDALYNLTVNGQSNSPVDHVISTNGIMSGDWLLQSNNDLLNEELFMRTTVLDLLDRK